MSPLPEGSRGTFRAAVAGLAIVAGLFMHGCGDSPDDKSGEGSGEKVSKDLPAGRFQLPTLHTPVPDLWITLPAGYEVKSVGRLPNDEFYIYRSDDPSLTDSTTVTPATLRVYIGVSFQSGLVTGDPFVADSTTLLDYPVVWKRWEEPLADGRKFYAREITAGRDLFLTFSPQLKNAPLHLHIYAGGTDSSLVEALAGSVMSIGLVP